MEAIGNQVKLPISTAVQIALQGIKIRLGRALVTITGVILGIAFLMNVLTGTLIKRAVADEEELRLRVNLMMSLVRSEIGNPRDRNIAVVTAGTLEEPEKALVTSLVRAKAHVRMSGEKLPGTTAERIERLGQGADVVMVLGAGKDCPASLDTLTAEMNQKVVLDSQNARTYAGTTFTEMAGIKRELFFGQREQQEKQKRAEREEQAKFRTIWIVTISLLVTIIGIANALLMSVTERFKEIGTMKCLGAMSSFIRQLFLIESAVFGVVGSLLGILIGIIFPMIAYSFAYGAKSVFGALSYSELTGLSIACLFAGTILSIIAAIYPATIAARMIPAMALRSNV